MKIREFTLKDLEDVKRLAQGQLFQVPNIESPLVIVKNVLEDENGRVRMAAFGRLHASAILLVDKTFRTPADRLSAVMDLQTEMLKKAGEMGLDIVTTQAEGRFGERLTAMGWVKGWGEMYYREVS